MPASFQRGSSGATLHVKAMLLLQNNMKEAIKYCNDGCLADKICYN